MKPKSNYIMNIRNATYKDAPFIKSLLASLGYTTNLSLLVDQLDRLFGQGDHQVYVYEVNMEVAGFVTVHYLPQLTFGGCTALISDFTVDGSAKGLNIAAALEKYVTDEARKKRCERIQVNTLDWRTLSHPFYLSRGYQEFPKYFIKRLVYAE